MAKYIKDEAGKLESKLLKIDFDKEINKEKQKKY